MGQTHTFLNHTSETARDIRSGDGPKRCIHPPTPQADAAAEPLEAPGRRVVVPMGGVVLWGSDLGRRVKGGESSGVAWVRQGGMEAGARAKRRKA